MFAIWYGRDVIVVYLYSFFHGQMLGRSVKAESGWYCIFLGSSFLERMSSGWRDVLAVGCDPLISGGVGPVSFVYPKVCLITASWLMSSPVSMPVVT